MDLYNLRQALARDIREDDADAVAALLDRHTLDLREPLLGRNWGALHLAQSDRMVSLLVRRGVDVDHELTRRTPLMAAARAGNADVVRALLNHGASPDGAAHAAVRGKDPISVWLALARTGVDLAAPDRHGETLLHRAAAVGSDAAVAFLLGHADTRQRRDAMDWLPVHHALAHRRSDDLIARLDPAVEECSSIVPDRPRIWSAALTDGCLVASGAGGKVWRITPQGVSRCLQTAHCDPICMHTASDGSLLSLLRLRQVEVRDAVHLTVQRHVGPPWASVCAPHPVHPWVAIATVAPPEIGVYALGDGSCLTRHSIHHWGDNGTVIALAWSNDGTKLAAVPVSQGGVGVRVLGFSEGILADVSPIDPPVLPDGRPWSADLAWCLHDGALACSVWFGRGAGGEVVVFDTSTWAEHGRYSLTHVRDLGAPPMPWEDLAGSVHAADGTLMWGEVTGEAIRVSPRSGKVTARVPVMDAELIDVLPDGAGHAWAIPRVGKPQRFAWL